MSATAEGRMRFAKGRVKKFAAGVEDGCVVPDLRGGTDEPASHPAGFTAHMRSGRRLLAFPAGTGHVQFVVTDAAGGVLSKHTRLRSAVAAALGGWRNVEVSDSCRVTVRLGHDSTRNVALVRVDMRTANPDAEWESERFVTAAVTTSDPEVVLLAVGLLVDPAAGGASLVSPLLDCMAERLPSRFAEGTRAERCLRFLFASPAPEGRVKKYEYDYGSAGVRRRVVYLNGRPVDTPDGEWHGMGC